MENEELTFEERLASILQAGMTPTVVCKACGRIRYCFEGNVESLREAVEEDTCYRCVCIGSHILLGDPDSGGFDERE